MIKLIDINFNIRSDIINMREYNFLLLSELIFDIRKYYFDSLTFI